GWGASVSKPQDDWFHALYNQHMSRLRRYVGRFIPSRETCEDLAQEAFVKLREQGIEPRYPQSYLYRTARNLAVDYMRHERISATDAIDIGEAESASDQPSAERELSAKEELAVITAALRELPPKCRLVFILLRLEGHTFREVAEIMHLSN